MRGGPKEGSLHGHTFKVTLTAHVPDQYLGTEISRADLLNILQVCILRDANYATILSGDDPLVASLVSEHVAEAGRHMVAEPQMVKCMVGRADHGVRFYLMPCAPTEYAMAVHFGEQCMRAMESLHAHRMVFNTLDISEHEDTASMHIDGAVDVPPGGW
jgi:hypothetical protein